MLVKYVAYILDTFKQQIFKKIRSQDQTLLFLCCLQCVYVCSLFFFLSHFAFEKEPARFET